MCKATHLFTKSCVFLHALGVQFHTLFFRVYGGGIVSAGQNSQHSVLFVCFEHQAVLKSIAVNVRKLKGTILKLFNI